MTLARKAGGAVCCMIVRDMGMATPPHTPHKNEKDKQVLLHHQSREQQYDGAEKLSQQQRAPGSGNMPYAQ